MFFVKKLSDLGSPWILSQHNDKQPIAISKDTTEDLKAHHILGIDFLYQNYTRQFKGAILNEEDEMNMHLQVAAFLNATFNSADKKFLVLIISPDNSLVKWHYHLKVHGGLKVRIVSHNTCPEDFDEEHGLALILSFSNIKLAEYLMDYEYFSVIVDRFDEIASKLIIKKLAGRFNIGLTVRSFYAHPNQKLQWTMLNWSNPGCVGKLSDFYEIDNDNFANFRDNYRHWWLRLTWNFCESFERVTHEEKQEYASNLAKWGSANRLINAMKREKNVKKRKKIEIIEDATENNGLDRNKKAPKKDEVTNKVYSNGHSEGEDKEVKDEDKTPMVANNSSEETIIYEAVDMPTDKDADYVESPSMDEHPILTSIMQDFEKPSEPVAVHQTLNNSTIIKNDDNEDDNVLISIIDNTNSASLLPSIHHKTRLSCKKEELMSQIFTNEPCTSNSVSQSHDDNSFFQSLIEPGSSIKVKGGSGKKQNRKDDVDDIFKETESLLRE